MFDVEAIINWLQGLPPLGVYAALWFTTYIENVFPPSPSDVVMLFIATLIGMGTIDFIPALGIATLGSVMGFLTAFLLGRRFGRAMTKTEKFPFITKKSVKKVDAWFAKYGYWVIVVNRFLAGTRAVVSFFAGMSDLKIVTTTVLCLVSALAWNTLIIALGNFVGTNWERGAEILRRYGLAVTIVLGAIVLFFLVRFIIGKIKAKREKPKAGEDE